MRKRIFIGIKISDPIFKDLSLWKKEYNNLPVRWIKNINLHVTLIPPWYEQEIEKTVLILENSVDKVGVNPFTLRFHRIGFGPNKSKPSLIWAKGNYSMDLVLLKQHLEKKLKIKPVNRRFLLHLTLARFREEDYEFFITKKIHDTINWQQKVESICLFESRLLRSGANYKVIKESKL